MSHTPGPWEIDANSTHKVLVWKGETLIADAASNFGTPWGVSEGEACGNARLIAAAPEMYEALQRGVDAVAQLRAAVAAGETVLTSDEWQDFASEARALLAKIDAAGGDDAAPGTRSGPR